MDDATKVKMFNWLLANRGILEKAINRALIECIRAHGGNIDISSASKRVIAELKQVINSKRKQLKTPLKDRNEHQNNNM